MATGHFRIVRRRTLLGPYRRPIPWVLCWSWGGWLQMGVALLLGPLRDGNLEDVLSSATEREIFIDNLLV